MADSSSGGRTARAAEADLGELKSDLAALRTELAAVVAAVKQLGETAVRTAKRQQATEIDKLAAGAETIAAEALTTGRDQLGNLEAKIREQPLAAVAIAFVAGLLFGSLRR